MDNGVKVVNIERIASLTSFFNNVLGTTQAQPIGNLYNFGGFTDGDRAIFLAVALGASEITLAGMDFGDIVTKYSRPNISNALEEADDFKKKKLRYAEKFKNLCSDEFFMNKSLPVFQKYMQYCIPEPFKTEISLSFNSR